jgi:hypothetical protein
MIGVWRTIKYNGEIIPRIYFGSVYDSYKDQLIIYGGSRNQNVTILNRLEQPVESYVIQFSQVFSHTQL